MERELTRREREELVDRLFGSAFSTDANTMRKHRAPGQAVLRMSAEDRRKLAQLTAADFQHRIYADGS